MSILKVNTIQDKGGNAIISSDGSGTLTLPSTFPVQDNAKMTPSFMVKRTSNQTISNATGTKIQMDIEVYDSNGCFNNTGSTVTLNGISTPSYSFAPNVSGKYFITVSTRYNASADWDSCELDVQKNGSVYARYNWRNEHYQGANLQTIVEMNGTSDYIHFQTYQTSGADKAIAGEGYYTYALGYRIIGA